ncbi:MAG: DOMON-like domain-containing protein [Sphingomonadaceae bacterium]|nr:DOMON-like domain-containing protein [Sphingomonadaceae bacterium]
MQMHRLIAHPGLPPRLVKSVQVRWRTLDDGTFFLRWQIDGANDVILPPIAGRQRADDLWNTTCFELFIDMGEGAYREFNFSPSGQWAAYDFSSYRQLARNAVLEEAPIVDVRQEAAVIAGGVKLPIRALSGGKAASLCAVIEENGGLLSFWSNAHHKEKPDFHDPTCFELDFAAPENS